MGKSGRGEFDEFSAKLEKHIDRLPDYAQRARGKLDKYLGSFSGGDSMRERPSSAPRGEDDEVAEGAARPARRGNADLTVVDDLRDKLAQWNTPEAKLERRKRWTRRAVTLLSLLTLLAVLWSVGGYLGITSPREGFEGAFFGIVASVVFAVLGVQSGLKLRRLHRVEQPVPSPSTTLPPPGSAAREPMERLAESEATLTELLQQLSEPAQGASPNVPGVSVDDARSTASEAAEALRAVAARVQSIERAKAAAPARERAGLDKALDGLRTQLDDGLEEYGALIAASGKAVAASSHGVEPAKESLTDATDRLAGLAMALRELS